MSSSISIARALVELKTLDSRINKSIDSTQWIVYKTKNKNGKERPKPADILSPILNQSNKKQNAINPTIDNTKAAAVLVGYFVLRDFPLLSTKCPFLSKLSLCVFRIKYGTTNKVKKVIVGFFKPSAKEKPIYISTQNIKFQKLSLLASFLSIFYYFYQTNITSIISSASVIDKAFCKTFAIISFYSNIFRCCKVNRIGELYE